MNVLHDQIRSVLPPRAKPSSTGNATRFTFDCPLCHTKGHTRDTKKRGAIFLDNAGGAGYDCFQCQTRTRQQPGQLLTRTMREVLQALGMSEAAIRQLGHALWSARYEAANGTRVILPDGLRSIMDWVLDNCMDARLLDKATFLQSGTPAYDLRDFYWTPDDNGIQLSQYIVQISGSISDPKGWSAYPYPDSSLPVRTHQGIEPEPTEPTIPQEDLDRLERLIAEDESEN